ncbi:hypothetical protein E2C01_084224 [Portunus trituberculatus]|uniref:Uncharacterized protein n=1 Tax=Portunus trituberculatus TaxID=210409 RepID=A0A5B7J5R4_PORTR|nr:hypothetical protein [Portunus trituberculatus]
MHGSPLSAENIKHQNSDGISSLTHSIPAPSQASEYRGTGKEDPRLTVSSITTTPIHITKVLQRQPADPRKCQDSSTASIQRCVGYAFLASLHLVTNMQEPSTTSAYNYAPPHVSL